MKTLALLSQKGGSGKSTLAVHLAVIAQAAGRRTVIVDLDPQRSAAGWWETRTAETPEMVETTPTLYGRSWMLLGLTRWTSASSTPDQARAPMLLQPQRWPTWY